MYSLFSNHPRVDDKRKEKIRLVVGTKKSQKAIFQGIVL